MNAHPLLNTRRGFLGGIAALAGTGLWARGAFAEELTKTPAQTEGPFYPDKLPLDTDNDLLIVNDSITPAVGDVTHLSGKILDAKGNPIKNALVEVWQVDAKAVYIHSECPNRKDHDKNFQGFGRFLTASSGEYYFRTIKPVAYPGRTPHIHFKIKQGGKELLVTQLYIKGEPLNEKDGIYKSVKDAKQREAITVDFAPIKGSKIGELAAKLDLVLGITPEMD
jgi:protocatechuate 3,4-dioxygenase beta subunit